MVSVVINNVHLLHRVNQSRWTAINFVSFGMQCKIIVIIFLKLQNCINANDDSESQLIQFQKMSARINFIPVYCILIASIIKTVILVYINTIQKTF